jgi:NRPS condensation-like uncharacterized protein
MDRMSFAELKTLFHDRLVIKYPQLRSRIV